MALGSRTTSFKLPALAKGESDGMAWRTWAGLRMGEPDKFQVLHHAEWVLNHVKSWCSLLFDDNLDPRFPMFGTSGEDSATFSMSSERWPWSHVSCPKLWPDKILGGSTFNKPHIELKVNWNSTVAVRSSHPSQQRPCNVRLGYFLIWMGWGGAITFLPLRWDESRYAGASCLIYSCATVFSLTAMRHGRPWGETRIACGNRWWNHVKPTVCSKKTSSRIRFLRR